MVVRKKKAASGPTQLQITVEQIMARLHPYRQEIIGSLLLLLSAITLLSLLSLTGGALSEWWAALFSQLFGWGAIPATILLGVLGGLLAFGRLRDEAQPLPLDIIIGGEVLFVVGLAGAHLVAAGDNDQALRLARHGAGGGFIGWGVSIFLLDLIGRPFTGLVLLLVGLAALGLVFRLTATDAAGWAEQASSWAQRHLHQLQPDANETAKVETAEPTGKNRQKQKKPSEKTRPLQKPAMTAKQALAAMPQTRYRLPPLDLLAPPTKDPTHSANARYQAQIIEETLHGFGIPSEVAEINRGPTVTQFGLKLGTLERKLPDGTIMPQRVRVNKVVSLSNDLALALSAAPIRIEAPVPGRPLVGIEVPNSEKTMVSLRGVLEDDSFKQGKGALRVALGKGVSGQAVSAPLAEMPHLLIAGATGSGKSVCINAMICTLLMTHPPEQLRFLLVDPKMVELTSYNGIPHLLAPVVTDFEHVVGALAWVTREMERRYKLFAANGARGIGGYNRKAGVKGERLPYLVVVIDELADLMMLAPDEVERHICRIAQMARATGIHLVIATQRPSVDVVTGLIKANFPTRLAFAVTSQIDSRVILDSPGAEKLLGRGDMLYMATDSPKLARLQGCFVSDAEIRNLVKYWQAAGGTSSQAVGSRGQVEETQTKLPWADIMAEANKDDMLEEAIKLVVESGRVSTSLLQRRLGIGYPRASRLIDQLEEEGVIGPAEGSRPREVLWRDEKDEADYAEFEKDVAGEA
ncbi:MAG: DNA translocase FtsK [Anaerolineae bacterium]|nr:DNA translocase FtsK [Anaerolineae bacterium]